MTSSEFRGKLQGTPANLISALVHGSREPVIACISLCLCELPCSVHALWLGGSGHWAGYFLTCLSLPAGWRGPEQPRGGLPGSDLPFGVS